jgi:hypothetical protein
MLELTLGRARRDDDDIDNDDGGGENWEQREDRCDRLSMPSSSA